MTDAATKKEAYRVPYHWMLSGFYAYLNERRLELAKALLDANMTIMDWGGGDGRMSALASPLVREIWCIDIDERALRFGELLASDFPNVRFWREDVRRSSFLPGMFDGIFAFDVIEHIDEPEMPGTLRAFRRLLKKNGFLVITTPNRRNLRARLFGERALGGHKHKKEYALDELTALLCGNGFRIAERKGIYLPIPIPKIEHVANLVGLRSLFRLLIRLGEHFPSVSETLWVYATVS